MDASILTTIIPPVLTAVFAYLVARKKALLSEKMNRAKLDADVQNQALTIVRGVMDDMRDEFKREIDSLRKEKDLLKSHIEENESQINNLRVQLKASDEITAMLKSEIATLRSTIKMYEEKITKLRKGV